MRSIYKYTLDLTDQQVIALPSGSQILSVQEQHGYIQVWAMVSTESSLPKKEWEFLIYGTGMEIPLFWNDGSKLRMTGCYLATVQIPPFVWHVFGKERD